MHFPPKFLKIVATRSEIFSLKFTKYRLAAGLCPDPLGELKCSPRPSSRNKGGLLLRGGEGKGGKGKGGGTCSKVLGGGQTPLSVHTWTLVAATANQQLHVHFSLQRAWQFPFYSDPREVILYAQESPQWHGMSHTAAAAATWVN